MRNTNRQKLLVGAGLLGVGVAAGFATPVSAAPRDRDVREQRKEVKEARKDLRKERKDVRQADTREERRDQRDDVRDAKRNLKNERKDLRQERRENTNGYRPGYNNGYRPGYNNGYVPRPGLNNGYRPGYTNRPVYNNRTVYRTLEGVVTADVRGDAFNMRVLNGQNIRVQLRGNEPNRLDRGDRVRVYGYVSNGIFLAQSLSIVRDR